MSLKPIVARTLVIVLLFVGIAFTATAIAVSVFPQNASAQCCAGGPCGACDVCALWGCYFQGFYESYYQGYYEGYYQSYYEGYYQSYYEGYYQGYYQSYYEGYYQSYYEGYYQGYYQSYYEGAYEAYYEGAYAPVLPDLTGTYLSPSSATAGSVTLQGRATNGGTAAAGSFTSYFEVQGNGTLTWTSATTLAAGANATVTANRTFSAGTYQVRVCVDGGGTVSESNESNNCSGWTTLVVAAAGPSAPTASLSASPTSVPLGNQSTLTWSSTNATSCTGGGFSTGSGSPISGSVLVTPSSPSSTYILTCTNAAGNATDSETVTISGGACSGAGPIFATSTPNRVEPGDNTTITWTGSNVSGCTLRNMTTNTDVKTSTATACSVSDSLAVSNVQAQTTYRLTCDSQIKDVVVNIVPQFEEF
jgi:hypothetical protein